VQFGNKKKTHNFVFALYKNTPFFFLFLGSKFESMPSRFFDADGQGVKYHDESGDVDGILVLNKPFSSASQEQLKVYPVGPGDRCTVTTARGSYTGYRETALDVVVYESKTGLPHPAVRRFYQENQMNSWVDALTAVRIAILRLLELGGVATFTVNSKVHTKLERIAKREQIVTLSQGDYKIDMDLNFVQSPESLDDYLHEHVDEKVFRNLEKHANCQYTFVNFDTGFVEKMCTPFRRIISPTAGHQ
jgi:hypothetical protein